MSALTDYQTDVFYLGNRELLPFRAKIEEAPSEELEREDSMPKKCEGPSCGKLVTGRQSSAVRLGDHQFCSFACKEEWLEEQHVEVHNNLTERTAPTGKLRLVNGG